MDSPAPPLRHWVGHEHAPIVAMAVPVVIPQGWWRGQYGTELTTTYRSTRDCLPPVIDRASPDSSSRSHSVPCHQWAFSPTRSAQAVALFARYADHAPKTCQTERGHTGYYPG